MWTSWTEAAKNSVTQALEKTGDVISRAATDAGKSARQQQTSQEHDNTNNQIESQRAAAVDGIQNNNNNNNTVEETDEASMFKSQFENNDIFKSLSSGWNTVVETTKASIQIAEEKVKEQQQIFQQKLSKARVMYYRRDPSLPLDVEALKDAEVVYITDRIITMGHPAMASQVDGEITGERKLAAIGHMLNRRHDGRFMVWNLSEVPYDVDILDDQVLTFSFPGSPSPPLGLLLKLLVSMESWLKADERNVAVVHCLTGKGRTSTVVAAFLCWMGEAGFSNVNEALEYIAACKQITPDELTIPSQRRYASYFKNMLDEVRPSQPPLMLKRIIMSEAPKYARRKLGNEQNNSTDEDSKPPTEEELKQMIGCVPYIQLFKAGKVFFTAPASLHFQQDTNEIPFCSISDGSISFHINQVLQGDILIRARHLTPTRKKISMFRAAFHTGYVPPKVMRLTKSQLDGACADERFPSDFFLDLIFEPADAEAAGKLLKEVEDATSEHPAIDAKPGSVANKLAGGGNLVTASAYDSMLHRDSRFWDVIAARKKLHEEQNEQANKDKNDPTVGPTVGRRRAFNGKPGTKEDSATNNIQSEKATLDAFTIGGEFDFLPAVIKPESDTPDNRGTRPTGETKKDSLLEALMGALDEDINEDQYEHEAVVFDGHPEGNAFMPTAPLFVDPTTDPTDEKKEPTESKPDIMSDTNPPEQSVPTPSPALSKQNSAVTKSSVGDASINNNDVDNMTFDMDALLSGVDGGGDGDVDDLLNFDMDDAELLDLENFLNKA